MAEEIIAGVSDKRAVVVSEFIDDLYMGIGRRVETDDELRIRRIKVWASALDEVPSEALSDRTPHSLLSVLVRQGEFAPSGVIRKYRARLGSAPELAEMKRREEANERRLQEHPPCDENSPIMQEIQAFIQEVRADKAERARKEKAQRTLAGGID